MQLLAGAIIVLAGGVLAAGATVGNAITAAGGRGSGPEWLAALCGAGLMVAGFSFVLLGLDKGGSSTEPEKPLA